MCAQKIEWNEPIGTAVTKVEISTAGMKYGNYTVATTIFATDDEGAKVASNSWITSYTDQTGFRTTWYKIRFYDGTNYSDYSDPITSEKEVNLCSIDDVKEVLDTVGRWTDTEIQTAITSVETDMEDETGTPIKAIYSDVGYNSNTSTTYKTYYTGEEKIYRVDRVFVGTTTRHELFLDDGYKVHKKGGLVRILPYASSGFEFTRDSTIEIRFVPNIYNRVATYRTAKFLLEKLDTISRGTPSKELSIINRRLDMLEMRLQHKIGVVLSSDFVNYDPIYGTNKQMIRQDHDRNKYIASYGWN